MISDPKNIVRAFGVKGGGIVADLGVGSGHMAFALSEAVGENGKVYAIDIQKGILERVKKESLEKGLKNIEIIWGDLEVVGGTKLREASVDVAVVANVLFQVESKAGLVHEASRILKTGGRLLLIDWYESFAGLGPATNAVVDEKTARRIFETGQFEFKSKIDAGEHHYGMIFEKKSA